MNPTFHQIAGQYRSTVEDLLSSCLREQDAMMSARMADYHLRTGGKRLRALIPPYLFAAQGRAPAEALPLGAAVEMIHNATLVHDDLQDRDQVRHDAKAVWKKFSDAQAINCGDAMFQLAYRLLSRLTIEPRRVIRIVDRAAASTLGVIEGQAQEFLMKDEQWPGVQRYMGVIRGKTAGLISLPVVAALEAMGMNADLCAAAETAAADLGMIFQIQDDLLDIYGDKGRKETASDISEGKISILVAHVNDTATVADKSELAAILRKPRGQTSDGDKRRAAEIFASYDAKGYAISQIRTLQASVARNTGLLVCPKLHRALVDLGAVFLEPLSGILGSARLPAGK